MSVTSPTMRRRMWKLEQLKMDSDLALRVINHVLDSSYKDFVEDMKTGTVFLEFFNKLNNMHMKINSKDNLFIHIENHSLFSKAINCFYSGGDFINGSQSEVSELARGVVAHVHEVDHGIIDMVMEAKELENMVRSANIDKLTQRHEENNILLSQILEDDNSVMEIPGPVKKRIESTTTPAEPRKINYGPPAQSENSGTAIAYACIALEAAGKDINSENINKIMIATGITGFEMWVDLFVSFMKTTSCDKMFSQIGSGSSSVSSPVTNAVQSNEKEKTEEEEMVGGFCMDDSSSDDSESD
ncbi:hypothetical protein SS50377_23348 [Spironucleus salmonicida]|uniref:Uncharacterized protein n=1 Tax=Spironucleus salmonicida TaxID=348837 RepID=V6LRE1_9EUKA|nr:hypothetical protein SS50377_23348 [Spironucleus salmonicida]|eukprot:EST47217.1 hypothetical protein SS50377_12728 [Spironucleus salmonicida]